MDKIILFIPMYNCEKQIVRVLDQLNKEIMAYVSEVIIVNNRSTDNGERVVCNYINAHKELPIKLLNNIENYGLGGSHKVAFKYAIENKYDYLIVLHGDDQGNIHDLLPILKSETYKIYDCCLGARFMKGSRLEGYSKFRTFGNHVYNIIYSLVCRFKVFDLGSGLNMYKVSMLESQYYKKYSDTLMFNCCMLMAIDYYKQNAYFFPISWREDDQVSNVKLFSQARRTLGILAKYAINRNAFIESEMRDRIVSEYSAQVVLSNEETKEI